MNGRKTGFLGLGTMGRPMAGRLLDAGVELRVFDVADDAARHFTARGTVAAATPAELGGWADLLILMVPHPDSLRQCLIGPDGAIHTLKPGSIVIDMSTSGPAVVQECGRQLAKRGIEMIDAPVGKGPAAAVKGDLTILMGGNRETCEAVEWLLRKLGSELLYCGPLGSGQVVKLVNNMVSCANAAVLAEAYALAKKAGVDVSVLTRLMPGTAADSWQLRNTVMAKALSGDFSPAFKLALARKDMRLALEMAEYLGVASNCTNSALEWYDRAAAAGLGELDRAALLLLADPELGRN
ncbi:MAG: hypothetical protein A3I62_01265 [Betaproteobacteria bacterium RIFCSPLOWO2_02_FULL_62_79]|nr:MAG: hypothetical protein A3I62_01265 [Betaproteobacteria bacterium RIFCSPLOWO2_02_FULL_62_79]